MGVSESMLTEEELEEYEAMTYLSRKEILQTYKRFSSLSPVAMLHDKHARFPFTMVAELPELRVNPFRDRLIKVFSSGDGMTFEDFLDMMSVFSSHAPKDVKIEYAFRIYDIDEDEKISAADLKEVITRLTGEDNVLPEEQMQQLIDNIFEESDLVDDDTLSFAEFELVMSKAPDFMNSFQIRL